VLSFALSGSSQLGRAACGREGMTQSDCRSRTQSRGYRFRILEFVTRDSLVLGGSGVSSFRRKNRPPTFNRTPPPECDCRRVVAAFPRRWWPPSQEGGSRLRKKVVAAFARRWCNKAEADRRRPRSCERSYGNAEKLPPLTFSRTPPPDTGSPIAFSFARCKNPAP